MSKSVPQNVPATTSRLESKTKSGMTFKIKVVFEDSFEHPKLGADIRDSQYIGM